MAQEPPPASVIEMPSMEKNTLEVKVVKIDDNKDPESQTPENNSAKATPRDLTKTEIPSVKKVIFFLLCFVFKVSAPHFLALSNRQAERFRSLTCVRKRVDGGYDNYSICGDEMSSEKMSIFGIGVFQYFNFLRSSTILFLFFFIFVIPMIGINYWSSYTAQGNVTITTSNSTNATSVNSNSTLVSNTTVADASFSLFSRFTLAGLGTAKELKVTIPMFMSSPMTISKGQIGLVYACIDVLVCLCFIFFIWYVRRQQHIDAEQVCKNSFSPPQSLHSGIL